MTRGKTQVACPEKVLGWIPWYGDVGLTAAQKGAVEAHAAECTECRAEIDMIMGALFQVDAELPDLDLAFEAVTQRLEDRTATASASEYAEGADFGAAEFTEDVHVVEYESMEDLAQLAEWALEEAPSEEAPSVQKSGEVVIQGPWSGSSLWAAAAACVLVSLGALAGALYAGGDGLVSPGTSSEWAQQNAADPSYSLATDGGGSQSDRTTPLVDVVFRENTSMSQISAFLRDRGAEIVSGPSSMGVFRLRLKAEASAPASRDAESRFLDRLKNESDGLAIFAEAVP